MSDRSAAAGFSGVVPVFPLPDLVFFPDALLPLHIFEPRYLAMVREARAGEGLLVVATLLPGWERDPGGAPAFHPVATVGRLVHVLDRPDGRIDILLHGLERVSLEEEFTDRPYRLARARALRDVPLPDDRPDIDDRVRRLFLTYEYTAHLAGRGGTTLLATFGDDESAARETVIHTVCQNLSVPVIHKLRALEASGPLARCEMAEAWLRTELDATLAARGLPRLQAGPGELN